jgi:hypothetical protein
VVAEAVDAGAVVPEAHGAELEAGELAPQAEATPPRPD